MTRRKKAHQGLLIALPCLGTLLLIASAPWRLVGRGGSVPAEFLTHRYWNYDPEAQEPRDPRQSCSLPALHPFHPAVWPYLNPVTPVVCKVRQPWLTYIDADGNLRFNASSGYTLSNLRCSYKPIRRVTDDKITYGRDIPFTADRTPINDDVISVSCSNFLKWPVYMNVHAVAVRRGVPTDPTVGLPNSRTDENKKRTAKSPTPTHPRKLETGKPAQLPNVFVFGLDSVSRLSMMRFLPKTYDYLVGQLGAVVFRGMNKVGDNTFPNLLALLTGQQADRIVKPGQRDKLYDDVHIVWQDFRRAGYETLFAEDFPAFALFNYLARGFTEPPTDYYLRPFWLAVYESYLLMSSSALCFGNTPKHTLQLDYLRRYFDSRNASSGRERPFFAFSYLVEISHDFSQQVGAVDDDFVEFLSYLNSGGHLENTFLIFLSDHGHRFDSIRSTFVGRIEERLPFFALKLPGGSSWLESRRGAASESTLSRLNLSEIESNLRSNSGRLTTPFDTYETLRDIASFGSRGVLEDEDDSPFGISLLDEVPRDRTCEKAGVPPDYCSCGSEVPIELNSPLVWKAANALVEKVNDLLTKFDEFDEAVMGRCAKLSLRRVHDAQELLVSEDAKNTGDGTRRLRVTVEVVPSAAMLEGMMLVNGEEELFDVSEDISRINKYGNQSHCIRHEVLRKFCYCLAEKPRNKAGVDTEDPNGILVI